MPEIRTRSLEGAVYNEVTDTWMIPQPDPFTLENVQRAYDNLASGKSRQLLTRTEAAEFSELERLKPTHYALNIYPRNEEEQWRVEMMKDVQLKYMPFDYVRLTHEEAEKVARTKSAANTFAEKSPYTVTYNYANVTDGGPTGPVTYQLPVLYAVWPVDKPLPTDLEYVVDYEVFLPPQEDAKTRAGALVSQLSEEAMPILLGEAYALARGGSAQTNASSAFGNSFIAWGEINTFDNVLGRKVPVDNLKITYDDGSYISSTYSAPSGIFSIIVPIPETEIDIWVFSIRR